MAIVASSVSLCKASIADSETWFDHLTSEQRVLLQSGLVLLGYYGGMVDGVFGPRTLSAITAFERDNHLARDGVLSDNELDVLSGKASGEIERLGLVQTLDHRSGLRIWIPTALLQGSEPAGAGTRYFDREGSIELTTFRNLGQSFHDLYSRLSKTTHDRVVSYHSFTAERFVVSGFSRGQWYYWLYLSDSNESVGYRLQWDEKLERDGGVLAVFLASFSFPERSALREEAQKEQSSKESNKPRPPPAQPVTVGSGFFVGRDGLLLTNQHVVDSCSTISVSGFGSANLLKEDERLDLAALQLTSPQRHSIATFRATSPELGEDVILIGYPLADYLGSSLTVSTGIVSAESGVAGQRDWFATNAGIQPGNSGGPILDAEGRVIGVAVAQIDNAELLASAGTVAPNVGFAISSTAAARFLSIFRIDETQSEPALGRSVKDVVEEARGFTVQIVCER